MNTTIIKLFLISFFILLSVGQAKEQINTFKYSFNGEYSLFLPNSPKFISSDISKSLRIDILYANKKAIHLYYEPNEYFNIYKKILGVDSLYNLNEDEKLLKNDFEENLIRKNTLKPFKKADISSKIKAFTFEYDNQLNIKNYIFYKTTNDTMFHVEIVGFNEKEREEILSSLKIMESYHNE